MRESPDQPSASTAVSRGAHGAAPGASAQDDWDLDAESITPLTRAEAEQLFGPKVGRVSRVTPQRVVMAQIAASLLVALIVGLFFGRTVAAVESALLGGAVCWVPGALFAWYLKHGGGSRSRWTLLGGEAVKVGVTLCLFVAIGESWPGVCWLPLLAAYLVALKVYWVALVL